MSFVFSAGDLLAAGRLVEEIIGSLREAGGARSEYQELQRQFESLDRALRHINRLNGPAAEGVKCAALVCWHPLEDFRQKIKKYEHSLGLYKSDGVLKDTARKLEWTFRKRNEVCKLRDYLSLHIGSINLMLVTHGLEMLDCVAEQADENQEYVRRRVEDSHTAIFKLDTSLRAQNRLVQDSKSMLQRLLGIVGGDIAAHLKVMAEMLSKVCITTQQMYSIVVELRASILSIDTRHTFFQTPVKVEDALGRIFPVPSEYSFDDPEAIIQRRFRKGPGQKQVKAGAYELCNARNTKQVISSDSGIHPERRSLSNAQVWFFENFISPQWREDLLRLQWFDHSSRKRKQLADELGDRFMDDNGHTQPVTDTNGRTTKRRRLVQRLAVKPAHSPDEEETAFKNIRVDAFDNWHMRCHIRTLTDFLLMTDEEDVLWIAYVILETDCISEYIVSCDVDSVDVGQLSDEFKAENDLLRPEFNGDSTLTESIGTA